MTAVVIILYRPDIAKLNLTIKLVLPQVDYVLLIDNTEGSKSRPEGLLNAGQYYALGRNTGIAKAQNVGIERARKLGCDHVLLLDQDSKPADNMVAELIKADTALYKSGEKVAAVGPVYIERQTGERSAAIHYTFHGLTRPQVKENNYYPILTDYVIASGSFIRISTIDRIGMMREDLFIDLVDTEWGMRARSLGYKSYIVPNARMEHSIGEKVANINRRNIPLHNKVRMYYAMRNMAYLLRVRSMGYEWRWVNLYKLPIYALGYPYLSKDIMSGLKYSLWGVIDGICGRLGPIPERWIV